MGIMGCKMNRKMLVTGIIMTVAVVGQILAAFWFYNPQASATRINIGWGVMMISAIFGWLPIFTFRKRGKVQGRSYVHTTVLVDSGVYAIVRHPQYLAGILLNVALTLITLHWLVAALGLISIILLVMNTYDEEVTNLDKFGKEYESYCQKVPRLNFLLGIWKVIRRK